MTAAAFIPTTEKIRINNDGKNGKDIDVEAIGYLEGYQEHKDESEAGNE